jgi:predicted nucleic acid-binding protein
MRCLDTSFLIDLLKGLPAAAEKARAMDAVGERLSVPAPVLTEVLRGAYFKGGKELHETLELMASLDVLVVDDEVAAEAGRMGAELLKRGNDVGTIDLLIAATAKLNRRILVTRDSSFYGIPDVAVETY